MVVFLFWYLQPFRLPNFRRSENEIPFSYICIFFIMRCTVVNDTNSSVRSFVRSMLGRRRHLNAAAANNTDTWIHQKLDAKVTALRPHSTMKNVQRRPKTLEEVRKRSKTYENATVPILGGLYGRGGGRGAAVDAAAGAAAAGSATAAARP